MTGAHFTSVCLVCVLFNPVTGACFGGTVGGLFWFTAVLCPRLGAKAGAHLWCVKIHSLFVFSYTPLVLAFLDTHTLATYGPTNRRTSSPGGGEQQQHNDQLLNTPQRHVHDHLDHMKTLKGSKNLRPFAQEPTSTSSQTRRGCLHPHLITANTHAGQ